MATAKKAKTIRVGGSVGGRGAKACVESDALNPGQLPELRPVLRRYYPGRSNNDCTTDVSLARVRAHSRD